MRKEWGNVKKKGVSGSTHYTYYKDNLYWFYFSKDDLFRQKIRAKAFRKPHMHDIKGILTVFGRFGHIFLLFYGLRALLD